MHALPQNSTDSGLEADASSIRFRQAAALLAVFLGIGIAMMLFLHAVAYDPEPQGPAPLQASPGLPASADAPESQHAQAVSAPLAEPGDYPDKLIIPAIGVTSKVRDVGLTPAGAMTTSGNFTDVGWYKYGTLPGDIGSAVMDGHVDNGLALAGVFKHLIDLKAGDDIYVTENDGTSLRFVVTRTDAYDYQNAPAQDIFSENDGRFLKLITCEGVWVPGGKTYDKRLVVTAQLQTT